MTIGGGYTIDYNIITGRTPSMIVLGTYGGVYGWHYLDSEQGIITNASLLVIIYTRGATSVTSGLKLYDGTNYTLTSSNNNKLLYLTNDVTFTIYD